jgi:hypothetical protein
VAVVAHTLTNKAVTVIQAAQAAADKVTQLIMVGWQSEVKETTAGRTAAALAEVAVAEAAQPVQEVTVVQTPEATAAQES